MRLPGLVPLAVLALVGCNHSHGPLSDTPDPTSLGNAGMLPPVSISTAYGLHAIPPPGVEVRGTLQGTTSPLTTQARPVPSLMGQVEGWGYGENTAPQTGYALVTWMSGPNLPVEPWNMAMEAPPEGGHGAHGVTEHH
jgi:hypothetical protein